MSDLRKRLFSAIDEAAASTAEKRKEALRPRKKKKRTKSAKKAAKKKRKAAKAKAKADLTPLDSLYLLWKANKNPKVKALSASKLIAGLKLESERFEALTPKQCATMAEKFRRAMAVVVDDEVVLASLEKVRHGVTLRDAWVKLVNTQIAKTQRRNVDLAT